MNRSTFLLPLLLVACATAPTPFHPPEADVRPVVAADVLDGRWSIAAVDGRAAQGMVIDWQADRLRLTLACNSGSATASRNGDKLSVGGIAMTERACEPARMALDDRVAATLREGVTMEFTPPASLRLVGSGGSLDLVRDQGVI